ncbi:MAG: hypothetical protein ACR2OZ_06535 [Verrucomicrobiales bacterium]
MDFNTAALRWAGDAVGGGCFDGITVGFVGEVFGVVCELPGFAGLVSTTGGFTDFDGAAVFFGAPGGDFFDSGAAISVVIGSAITIISAQKEAAFRTNIGRV